MQVSLVGQLVSRTHSTLELRHGPPHRQSFVGVGRGGCGKYVNTYQKIQSTSTHVPMQSQQQLLSAQLAPSQKRSFAELVRNTSSRPNAVPSSTAHNPESNGCESSVLGKPPRLEIRKKL
eukprot:3106566-Amphidinium_carterae.1